MAQRRQLRAIRRHRFAPFSARDPEPLHPLRALSVLLFLILFSSSSSKMVQKSGALVIATSKFTICFGFRASCFGFPAPPGRGRPESVGTFLLPLPHLRSS